VPGHIEQYLGAVVAGLVPAMSIILALRLNIVVAGTSPATTASASPRLS